MKINKKKKKPFPQRGTWGDISPITKIIPNKKKHPKEKYKHKIGEE